MNKNNYLTNARKSKKDEFYTQYKDIESEMIKFKEKFAQKVVYCPCDNEKSQFPVFFKDNFHIFGLKGLYYSAINGHSYYYDGVNEQKIGGKVDIRDEKYREIARKSDIIVTNPPFSKFVEFLNGIISMEKDYIIVGNQNELSCKSIFKHIMSGKAYVDYGFKGLAGYFFFPEGYSDYAVSGSHQEGMIRVSGVIWYTSFKPKPNDFVKINPQNRFFDEHGNKNLEKYPLFDNFRRISGLQEDAINVGRVKDIPCDYKGIMGVPISFMGKYNPEQFEIIQLDHYGPLGNLDNIVNGKQTYRRIYIKRR